MRKFLTDVFTEKEANVIAFGVPLGKYGKSGIYSLREASWFVEPFDLDRKANLLENVRVFDTGDLRLASLHGITDSVKKILGGGKIPFMLGGNHLSTLHSFQAFPSDTRMVVFDAHCDTKDEYMDEKIREMGTVVKKSMVDKNTNDTTWLRRLCEKKNPKNIIVLGVRAGDEEELGFLRSSGILYYTSEDIRTRTSEVSLILHQFTKLSNVYVSLDIDVFDPGIAPAVDYPEPCGIQFNHFRELMNAMNGKLVGLDMCCLKPIKGNQITEFLAIKSIFEILGKI